MTIWITNKTKIAHEPPPGHPYFLAAYTFARDWLNGKDEIVLKTSGSTGVPQPIPLLRKQLVASAKMTGRALDLGENTRALICLNVAYIAGTMMLVRSLELHWEMVLVEPSSNPLEAFTAQDSFDFVAMVPMQVATILKNPRTAALLENCGKVLIGGAPVSASLLEEIQKCPTPMYQSYGMTETVSHVALRRLNGPTAQTDYHVLDGIKIGADARGCLHVQGEVTNSQTIQTNDLVLITSEHTFQWLGRADSVIISGGVKIHLNEVEAQVLAAAALDMDINFFAWYVLDDTLGQKLVLFVEGTPNAFDLEKLKVKLKQEMNPYLIPKEIYFVPRFQLTPTAKLDKIATSTDYFNHLL